MRLSRLPKLRKCQAQDCASFCIWQSWRLKKTPKRKLLEESYWIAFLHFSSQFSEVLVFFSTLSCVFSKKTKQKNNKQQNTMLSNEAIQRHETLSEAKLGSPRWPGRAEVSIVWRKNWRSWALKRPRKSRVFQFLFFCFLCFAVFFSRFFPLVLLEELAFVVFVG